MTPLWKGATAFKLNIITSSLHFALTHAPLPTSERWMSRSHLGVALEPQFRTKSDTAWASNSRYTYERWPARLWGGKPWLIFTHSTRPSSRQGWDNTWDRQDLSPRNYQWVWAQTQQQRILFKGNLGFASLELHLLHLVIHLSFSNSCIICGMTAWSCLEAGVHHSDQR